MRPNAFDVFKGVWSQVHLPATYSAQDMQKDMIKYMKQNKEELEVNYVSHFKKKQLRVILLQWS